MIGSILRKTLQGSPIARFISILVSFAVFFLLSSTVYLLSHRNPSLISILPPIGEPGTVIVLQGKHFGQRASDGWVEIAGNRISGNAYISWNDSTIMLTLPETVKDGLVYVSRGRFRSNPLMYANKKNIPITRRGTQTPDMPVIQAISQDRIEIGKVLTLRGKNFGLTRGNSRVLFTWNADSQAILAVNQKKDSMVPCSEQDFDYEFWSDQEVRIRVPDGASTGSLVLETERGISNSQEITIISKPGTKEYTSPRTYAISLQVDITDIQASAANILYLRLPIPKTTTWQRDIELTASKPIPYMDNYRGTILHQLENIKSGQTERISHTFVLTGYGVTTKIQSQLVKPFSDTRSPLYLVYTAADPLVPSSHQDIILKAAELVSTEKNPYKRAKAIYTWLTDSFEYKESEKADQPVLDALTHKSGSAYDMAILFSALARAAGIPAVPVAGILVDAERNSRVHWWAEFYLENFGWIPVDPALAMGKPYPIVQDNPKEWYFGNMDGQRIAFSRGWTEQSAMSPNSRIVFRPRSWAFQQIWEESGGNLRSYASLWRDPIVTGVY